MTEIDIIILGEHSVGKKSLLSCYFQYDAFGKYAKTGYYLSPNYFSRVEYIDGKEITIKVWNPACKSTSVMRNNDICILMFDTSVYKTFENLLAWKEEHERRNYNRNCKYYLIGNKIDTEMNTVTMRNARQWCQDNNIEEYFQVSCKEGINVQKAFHTMINKILTNHVAPDYIMGSIGII